MAVAGAALSGGLSRLRRDSSAAARNILHAIFGRRLGATAAIEGVALAAGPPDSRQLLVSGLLKWRATVCKNRGWGDSSLAR